MKQINSLGLCALLGLVLLACNPKNQTSDPLPMSSWKVGDFMETENLQAKAYYLPLYTSIYSQSEHRRNALTSTVSIRNVMQSKSIFLHRADLFNTEGDKIKAYIEEGQVKLSPLETIEIVLGKDWGKAGSGGNFIFEFHLPEPADAPLIEAVMISTSGQQGLSFSSRAVEIQY